MGVELFAAAQICDCTFLQIFIEKNQRNKNRICAKKRVRPQQKLRSQKRFLFSQFPNVASVCTDFVSFQNAQCVVKARKICHALDFPAHLRTNRLPSGYYANIQQHRVVVVGSSLSSCLNIIIIFFNNYY